MLALRLVSASVTAMLPQLTGEGASALADMGLTPASLGDTAAEFSSALAAAMQEAVAEPTPPKQEYVKLLSTDSNFAAADTLKPLGASQENTTAAQLAAPSPETNTTVQLAAPSVAIQQQQQEANTTASVVQLAAAPSPEANTTTSMQNVSSPVDVLPVAPPSAQPEPVLPQQTVLAAPDAAASNASVAVQAPDLSGQNASQLVAPAAAVVQPEQLPSLPQQPQLAVKLELAVEGQQALQVKAGILDDEEQQERERGNKEDQRLAAAPAAASLSAAATTPATPVAPSPLDEAPGSTTSQWRSAATSTPAGAANEILARSRAYKAAAAAAAPAVAAAPAAAVAPAVAAAPAALVAPAAAAAPAAPAAAAAVAPAVDQNTNFFGKTTSNASKVAKAVTLEASAPAPAVSPKSEPPSPPPSPEKSGEKDPNKVDNKDDGIKGGMGDAAWEDEDEDEDEEAATEGHEDEEGEAKTDDELWAASTDDKVRVRVRC